MHVYFDESNPTKEDIVDCDDVYLELPMEVIAKDDKI